MMMMRPNVTVRVVYCIALPRGRVHVSQTLNGKPCAHLASHCSERGHEPCFYGAEVVARQEDLPKRSFVPVTVALLKG